MKNPPQYVKNTAPRATIMIVSLRRFFINSAIGVGTSFQRVRDLSISSSFHQEDVEQYDKSDALEAGPYPKQTPHSETSMREAWVVLEADTPYAHHNFFFILY
jgi:hypothetical protein